MTISLPSWRSAREISPMSGFAAAVRSARDSMPWVTALRSMCSKGHHLVENRTVDFDLATLDVEVGAFAQFLGGLADDAVEAFGLAGEGAACARPSVPAAGCG